jgi:uncharacterized protein YkwD
VRYLAGAGNGRWRVKILAPSVDLAWPSHGYNAIHGALELSALVPELNQADFGVGQRNVMLLTPDQRLLLEERVATTRKISLRVDGPMAGNSNIMDWQTGCVPNALDGPTLEVQFEAEPGEPTPVDLPESRQRGLEMIEAINAARREGGLNPLQMSEPLMTAARVHNLDIAYLDLWTHQGTDGSLPPDRVRRAGFDATWVGEVLAKGSTNVPAVLNAWLGVPAQKEQFMRPSLTHIGAHWTPAPRALVKNFWTVVTAEQRR